MKFIVCLDDKNGMLFNNRRQSRDRVVTEDIICNLADEKLLINEFSAKLFAEYGSKIELTDAPIKNRFFFAENLDLSAFETDISQIVVYRWNRIYPADFVCNIDFSKYNVDSQVEFAGNSHEKITKITYIKA